MIDNEHIVAAVSRISQRAEKQEDLNKLISIYVDVGILPQLNNTNHQVFYGRRGTGKTHVLKVLASKFEQDQDNTVVYIDCRTLGSTSQFSDTTIALPQRCLSLFRDILIESHKGLQRHIATTPSNDAIRALEALDEMLRVSTAPSDVLVPVKSIKRSSVAEKKTTGVKARISAAISALGAGGDIEKSKTNEQSRNQETDYQVHRLDKIVFPELAKCLRDVMTFANTKLYVLIDEWSSLPTDVQPYLAEFLKRSILPLPPATLKIAALEHRCRFSLRDQEKQIGFELGADIAANQDMDDYFVYDRNPPHATKMFSEILYRHVNSELPKNRLKKDFRIENANRFIGKMFTNENAFSELVRASEGVVRDLINIFTRAFFYAKAQGRKNLDTRSIHYAARQWFEQDKATALDGELNEVLKKVINQVIGARKTRSFMLPRELERHPVIQRLFDSRVLHLVARGYADKDNTGIRYNIYNIDYGTYVDLLGTTKEPEGFTEDGKESSTEFVVPFDDKRKIRRVILNEQVLR